MSFPSVCMSVIVAMCTTVHHVHSHGWLVDPPSRSSLWKVGFDTPPNYNHNQLNCGGLPHQTSLGGKCGLCGDPYDGVRHNEAGGTYAQGIITRTYRQGEIIQITVNVTAAHGGYFEFKLCANNDFDTAITQECLDRHVLTRADNPGETRFSDVPFGSWDVANPRSFVANISYILPPDLSCRQCVLQWVYTTAHNPGAPYQEEFYGCSDVAIVSSGVTMMTPPTTKTTATTTALSPEITVTTKQTTRASSTPSPKITTTTVKKTVPVSTTTKTVPPTMHSTTRRTTRATTPTTQTSSKATVTTTTRPTTSSSSKATPTRTTGETTITNLSYVELYQRCKAKGVIEDIFTQTCRELCVRPSECPKTFCNPYCVLLYDAKP